MTMHFFLRILSFLLAFIMLAGLSLVDTFIHELLHYLVLRIHGVSCKFDFFPLSEDGNKTYFQPGVLIDNGSVISMRSYVLCALAGVFGSLLIAFIGIYLPPGLIRYMCYLSYMSLVFNLHPFCLDNDGSKALAMICINIFGKESSIYDEDTQIKYVKEVTCYSHMCIYLLMCIASVAMFFGYGGLRGLLQVFFVSGSVFTQNIFDFLISLLA
jgi:hypothetical protein